MEPHNYTVDIHWENSRKGIICSPELNKEQGVCIEVATPPDFSKGIKGIWSPEHLFVASISACLMTTFLAIAESSTLEFTSFECNSIGKLEQIDNQLTISAIHLNPTVVIRNEKFRDKAIRIVKKAEATCLISNSVTSKITMAITIKVQPLLITTS